jgi:NADH-quinone oxidoreductase subunit A
MTQGYLVIALLIGFVAFNAALLIGLSHLVSPSKPTVLKGTPYESGMPPLGSARERFSVKFYLVAMLFIVFDIETVFLIPWATIYFGAGDGGGAGPTMGFLLVEALVFIGILFAGYVYVWKRGAFEWD